MFPVAAEANAVSATLPAHHVVDMEAAPIVKPRSEDPTVKPVWKIVVEGAPVPRQREQTCSLPGSCFALKKKYEKRKSFTREENALVRPMML
jgi:hypothetical protein